MKACFKITKKKALILAVCGLSVCIFMYIVRNGEEDSIYHLIQSKDLDNLFLDIVEEENMMISNYDLMESNETDPAIATPEEIQPTYQPLDDEQIDNLFSNIVNYTAGNNNTAPKINFIPKLKSPCFYVSTPNNVTGDTSTNVRCLPRIFILGFPKCGTTDLHFRLLQHQHLFAGVDKEPMFWSSIHRKSSKYFEHYTCMYSYGADFIQNYCGLGTPQEEMNNIKKKRTPRNCMYPNICYLRSPQWSYCKDFLNWSYRHRKFNNSVLKLNQTMQAYLDPLDMIDICGKISFLDSSPDTMWLSKTDKTVGPENHIKIPTAMHLVIPNAKYLVIMRNPVDRLWSDFKYFYKDLSEDAPMKFHDLVVSSIAWWKRYSQNLSFPDVQHEKKETGLQGMLNIRVAEMLRIGIYHIFIEEWLRIIPRQQFYFIKLEDYYKNPLLKLEHGIYQFLGLDEVSFYHRNILIAWQIQGKNLNKKRMKKGIPLKMRDSTKTLLENFYRPYNNKLVQLLKDKSYKWF